MLISCFLLDGWCLLHSTSGELLHKLVPSSSIWSHPHMIVYSPKNHFIIHYADQKGCLTAFSCNGKQLAYRPLNEPALVCCLIADIVSTTPICFLYRDLLYLLMVITLFLGVSVAEYMS